MYKTIQEDPWSVPPKLKEILGGCWRPYKDHFGNYAFKGHWKGFDIRIYKDTGDGLWRAVTTVFGQVLAPWARCPERVLESLRSDIYRILAREHKELRALIGEESANLIDVFASILGGK